MTETLGKRLTAFRNRNGLSQEALAEKLLVSRQSIGNWENDLAKPSIDYIKDLAAIYGVSIDDLLDLNKPIEACYLKEEKKSDDIIVSITKDGIYVKDKDKTVNVSKDHNKHYSSNRRNDMIQAVSAVLTTLTIIAVLVSYFTVSGLYPEYFARLWPLFFLIPIPGDIYKCVARRNPNQFPIIFVACFSYCFIGAYYGLWHPYWAIMFMIPIYYIVVGQFSNVIKSIKKVKEEKETVIDAIDKDVD